MAIHELKTWPEPFGAVVAGRKNYEIRRNDRGFEIGDLLHLREWQPREGHPDGGFYTGYAAWREVTYISKGGTWGLPADLCVMSLSMTVASDGATLATLERQRP
jgi:hypothetical protein